MNDLRPYAWDRLPRRYWRHYYQGLRYTGMGQTSEGCPFDCSFCSVWITHGRRIRLASLDNVRHGMSVDYVEGCKSCHDRDVFVSPRLTMVNMIHQTHVSSFKFPQQKNNCTLCHLTRESALRPSLHVCSSCHPEPHGTMFQAMQLGNDFDPKNDVSVYGNCARQCHENTPPTQHILPAQ